MVKPYRLFRNGVVLGISFDLFDHDHWEEDVERTGIDEAHEKCLTIEFMFWGVDIIWKKK